MQYQTDETGSDKETDDPNPTPRLSEIQIRPMYEMADWQEGYDAEGHGNPWLDARSACIGKAMAVERHQTGKASRLKLQI